MSRPEDQGRDASPKASGASDSGVNQGETEDSTVSRETDASLPRIGQLFANRYQIHQEIGRGGFGVVFRAFDTSPLQRTVALKIIRSDATGPTSKDPALRQRFLQETRLAGGLSHNNIATIYDVGEYSGCLYMTQELVPGRDLQKLLAESGPFPLQRVLSIVRQVCEGLAHAHGKQIVHRDIKPGNLLIDPENHLKITDFGVAQSSRLEDATLSGKAVGTPGYMSPEQLRGESVDARSDIFAVGCVLYQMLTGRRPFEGGSYASVVDKTLNFHPPGPSRIREDLPSSLDRILARAMRKDPNERYNSVTLFQQDLLNYQQFDSLLDSESSRRELGLALDRRECILFLGLRLPIAAADHSALSAEDLIADYLTERLAGGRGSAGLARIAQDLEFERGREEMLRHLTTAVKNPRVSPREIIRRVARLPFPVLVTTGYDTFLDEELARAGRKVRSILNCREVPDESAGEDLLIRLFGSIERQESIVVTEDDLWEFFGSFHTLSDVLMSLFATRSILFIGYDPESENFRHLFSEISRFRDGKTKGCYLPTTDASLTSVRWADKKGLRLVDEAPGAFLAMLEEALVEHRRKGSSPVAETGEAPLPGRPYKFLNFFEAEDERIFFGRKAETAKMLSKIRAYPLNLLYAPSGSGKTSLIHAGLIPNLRREHYCPIYARVYDDPEGEIRRAALAATGKTGKPESADLPLPELLSQLAAKVGAPLVIFADQLEELFIRYDREVRDRFAACLQSCLAKGRGQVRFVLSMREDFLARLSEFRNRIPNIFHNELRLDPLSEEACRAAIIEPAKLLGIEVQPDLVDRLIEDLKTEGIEPPQLQIVCDTLYDALEQGGKRITLASYKALGETRKILTSYLERVLRELPSGEREAARGILKSLVTSEETKSVCRIPDLVRIVGKPEQEIVQILSELSNRRLIRRVTREEGFWYELTHEYLVEEIGRWLSEREREIKKIRELLEQALRNYRHLGILMPQAQIRLIRAREEELDLSKEERQLLRQSEMSLRSRRQIAALVAGLASLALLAAGVLWRYWYLNTHVFFEAADREQFAINAQQRASYRYEGISVAAGSPARLWLDARLGFPRFIRQTDYELAQVEPAFRDSVKKGLVLRAEADVTSEIFRKLVPQQQVAFLVTSGRMAEAAKVLPDLYRNPLVEERDLDFVTSLMACSGFQDDQYLDIAERHAFRSTATPQWFVDQTTASVRPYLSLLANHPREIGRDRIVARLATRSTLAEALASLAHVGTSEDARLAVPYLEDREWQFRTAAMRALEALEGCSALQRVRELASNMKGPWGMDASGILEFISHCGNESDLLLLDELVQFRGHDDWIQFQAMSAEFRIRLRSTVASNRSLAVSRLSKMLVDASDPDAQGLAISLLAEEGETACLRLAGSMALDGELNDYMRSDAVRAIASFRGPEIRTFLLALLRVVSPELVRVRAAAFEGLRWYDDPEVFQALVEGLGEGDSLVRRKALEAIAVQSSERAVQSLRELLKSRNGASRVYAASALAKMGSSSEGAVFRDFLQTESIESTDFAAIIQGIIGLRDSFLDEPIESVLLALQDPHHAIRLAATLALIEHPQRSEAAATLEKLVEEADPSVRISAQRAQWAIGVGSRMDALRDSARDAFEAGNLLRAQQLINNPILGEGGFDALWFGLSQTYTGVFDRRDAAVDILRSEVALRRGDTLGASWQLRELLLQKPWLRKSIGENPRLQELRARYSFRILTGLEPPLLVEHPGLPEVPDVSKSASSRKAPHS